MEKAVLSKTQVFLYNASLFYKDMCPEQARFLMRKQQINAPALPDTVLCPFCFQWRRPGEYRVRLQPKCGPSVCIRKLLKREQAHKRLRSQEIKLLQRFRRASSVLMATCHICNKTSKQIGMTRDFPKNTPMSMSKCRTPQSANKVTPKPNLHDKTPNRTPTARTPECTSSSKSGSSKKSAFSRLKTLLMHEGSQKSKKGGLKDFLTSL